MSQENGWADLEWLIDFLFFLVQVKNVAPSFASPGKVCGLRWKLQSLLWLNNVTLVLWDHTCSQERQKMVQNFLLGPKIPKKYKISQNQILHFPEALGYVSTNFTYQSKSTTWIYKWLKGFQNWSTTYERVIGSQRCYTNCRKPCSFGNTVNDTLHVFYKAQAIRDARRNWPLKVA